MLTPIVHNGYTYFTVEEQACRHCGRGRLAPGFDTRVLEFRLLLDEPMLLSSCCRCTKHNMNEDGHPRSLHVFDYPYWPTEGTCALDVQTWHKPPEYRQRIINLARKLGWSIGFGNSFLHLDRRTDYTSKARAEFDY